MSEPKVLTTMVGDIVVGETNWGDENDQMKKVWEDSGRTSTNIRVALRCRPPNKRELAGGEGGGVVVKVPGPAATDGIVEVKGTAPFSFDLAFPMTTTQLEVFESIGIDIVNCAFHGYNASLFAYGQTSSGKSFSMMGITGSDLVGIIPRISRLLFAASAKSDKNFTVETSYLEIYNEKLRDLLSDGKQKGEELKIRENKQLGVHVAGLNREVVSNADETLAVIDHGFNQRTTAATLYNSESSRSHAVFEIHIKAKYKDTLTNEDMVSSSRIALIDLAGSERSDKLGSTGSALKEGNNINKSLTVLGRCIRALVELSKGKKLAVPFRESVLTWYLRDSLSGNARTTMLAACSPVESNMEETLSTLRYAASAKNIKTAAKKNEDPAQAKIRELASELEKLKHRLEEVEHGEGGGGGTGGSRPDLQRKPSSLSEMSKEEKQKLFDELNSQLGDLSDGNTGPKKTSIINSAAKVDEYPQLSCLNKDSLLSHAMKIPLSKTIPFTIGRTLSVTSSSQTTNEQVATKNDFEINGMGIKARHCQFTLAPDAASPLDGLILSPMSKGATVCVNGVELKEDNTTSFAASSSTSSNTSQLKHMDRIVLGPGRLLCLYLTQPLSPEERLAWDYDACFKEMIRRGERSATNSGGNGTSTNLNGTSSLLSSTRSTIVNEMAQVQAEQIAQANIISSEMGVSIRFVTDMVVRGKDGIEDPNLTVDDYLDCNDLRIHVRCFADKSIKIETAEDLGKSSDIMDKKLSNTNKKKTGGDENEEDRLEASIDAMLFEMTVDDFEDLLQDLKLAHSNIATLTGGLMDASDLNATNSSLQGSEISNIRPEEGMIASVFKTLDEDNSGFIDRDELERGLMIFNTEQEDNDTFFAEIWIEENLPENVELNYEQFEKFLIRFMKRQFFRCIESIVVNKKLFTELGGRDIQNLMKNVAKERAVTLHRQQSVHASNASSSTSNPTLVSRHRSSKVGFHASRSNRSFVERVGSLNEDTDNVAIADGAAVLTSKNDGKRASENLGVGSFSYTAEENEENVIVDMQSPIALLLKEMGLPSSQIEDFLIAGFGSKLFSGGDTEDDSEMMNVLMEVAKQKSSLIESEVSKSYQKKLLECEDEKANALTKLTTMETLREMKGKSSRVIINETKKAEKELLSKSKENYNMILDLSKNKESLKLMKEDARIKEEDMQDVKWLVKELDAHIFLHRANINSHKMKLSSTSSTSVQAGDKSLNKNGTSVQQIGDGVTDLKGIIKKQKKLKRDLSRLMNELQKKMAEDVENRSNEVVISEKEDDLREAEVLELENKIKLLTTEVDEIKVLRETVERQKNNEEVLSLKQHSESELSRLSQELALFENKLIEHKKELDEKMSLFTTSKNKLEAQSNIVLAQEVKAKEVNERVLYLERRAKALRIAQGQSNEEEVSSNGKRSISSEKSSPAKASRNGNGEDNSSLMLLPESNTSILFSSSVFLSTENYEHEKEKQIEEALASCLDAESRQRKLEEMLKEANAATLAAKKELHTLTIERNAALQQTKLEAREAEMARMERDEALYLVHKGGRITVRSGSATPDKTKSSQFLVKNRTTRGRRLTVKKPLSKEEKEVNVAKAEQAAAVSTAVLAAKMKAADADSSAASATTTISTASSSFTSSSNATTTFSRSNSSSNVAMTLSERKARGESRDRVSASVDRGSTSSSSASKGRGRKLDFE